MRFIKYLWNDPVLSKVIAAGILAIPSYIWSDHFWGWPQKIGLYLDKAWAWFTSDTFIPIWLLALLLITSLLGASLILARVYSHLRKDEWQSYTEDEFLGITWRWHYEGSRMKGFVPFCPQCGCQIRPQLFGGLYSPVATSFVCDNCKLNISKLNEQYDDILNKIQRLALLKISNNTWKNRNGK